MLEKRASTGYVSFFSGIRLNIRNSFVGYFIFFLCMTLVDSSYGARWVKVEVAEDSGDTYLWPYFYSASRFVDVESIKKNNDSITYLELVNSERAISTDVASLIVSKKSYCDGEKVVWENFAIYRSLMGQGKPIMRLNPNETQILKKGSSGALTDAFACRFIK